MPQLLRAIRPMFKTDRWRICRDDVVYILSGPDKGKTGKVLEVVKDQRVPRVIVEGRNLRKKKIRTGPGDDDYFVVTMEAPLHYSQVQVADPETGRPTRVVFMFTPDGKRVRARKVPNPTINDIIPTPPEDPDPRAGLVGAKDTPAQLARQGTYLPSAGFPFRVRNLERIWAGLHPDVPSSPPPITEGDNEKGRVGRVGGGGSRVLFPSALPSSQSPLSAGSGIRGLCTATSSSSSSKLAATVHSELGEGGLGDGMLRDDDAPHMLPLAASFALTGLRQQLCGEGSREGGIGNKGQGFPRRSCCGGAAA